MTTALINYLYMFMSILKILLSFLLLTLQNRLKDLIVGTASATSLIPWHFCIFALMTSHAVINLWPWQACSSALFLSLTTWYYSLIFYHHLHDPLTTWLHIFSILFISCYVHSSFLRHRTTLECDIWGNYFISNDTSSYIILTMYM